MRKESGKDDVEKRQGNTRVLKSEGKKHVRSRGTEMGMEGAMGHGVCMQETEALTKRE